MVELSQIRAYAEAIAREFKPEKIILFGSYAYGTPTEDSDVDLLILMAGEKQALRQAFEIRRRLDGPGFPLDLIVRDPADIPQRIRWGDWFLEEITTKGRVLYESCS